MRLKVLLKEKANPNPNPDPNPNPNPNPTVTRTSALTNPNPGPNQERARALRQAGVNVTLEEVPAHLWARPAPACSETRGGGVSRKQRR